MTNPSIPRRTRVKICGITRPEDGVNAAYLGADAVGLVFYAPSPRHVSIAEAEVIVAELPPFVTTVALFVDAETDAIRRVLDALPIDLLQFHGTEDPAACARYGKPYIKALAVRADCDFHAQAQAYAGAAGLLFDSYSALTPGGSGQCCDWTLIPKALPRPMLLAGGLNANNVADAIRTLQPYGVDVSSAVESSKGIKDAAKMAAFIQGVQDVDTE